MENHNIKILAMLEQSNQKPKHSHKHINTHTNTIIKLNTYK